MEEMLHMTLASNVLNAVGGTPVLASQRVVQSYPSRIPFSGLSLEVPLAAFSEATMCGLRTVETPDELAPKNPVLSTRRARRALQPPETAAFNTHRTSVLSFASNLSKASPSSLDSSAP
jgi:hypothetical protein